MRTEKVSYRRLDARKHSAIRRAEADASGPFFSGPECVPTTF